MSEKRKNSDSPKPKTTKFKLRTKKRSNVEENINNGETTPKRYSGHSTPIRKSSIANSAEDSPETDYRCSPIMGLPCTQQSEVAWSWSPKENNFTTNVLKTPKRSAQLQKRRIADSPLMFANLKVQAKKQDNVDQFMANFVAFNKESEPVSSTSENPEKVEQNKSNSSKNSESCDEGEMKLVYPDDHLEDSLVRCSQMIEEEFLSQISKEQEAVSSVFKIEEKKSLSQITGLRDLIKVPIEKSKISKTPEEKIIRIPDDSFDECLSQFLEDDFKKIESPQRPEISRPRSFVSKKSLFPNNGNSKFGSTKSFSTLDTKKSDSGSNDRLLAKTRSFDCPSQILPLSAKPVPKNSVKIVEKKPESSPNKFFKSKSHSEPFLKDPKSFFQKKPPVVHNPQNGGNIIGKFVQCKIFSDSALSQSVGSGSSAICVSSQSRIIANNSHNVPLSNPRSMVGLDVRRKNNIHEVACTAEEIERKRIEAKMRLEAKRKQNTTRILPKSINR